MKTLFFAAAIAALTALNLSAASAAQYGPPTASSGAPSSSTGHWEWQYHYAGHHPRYQGYWAWVK
jgi:Spy/CpxP family protein refolding chaperone